MKLHVHTGPLPIAPPYLEWQEEVLDPLNDDDEEIDLTDLFGIPRPPRDIESVN